MTSLREIYNKAGTWFYRVSTTLAQNLERPLGSSVISVLAADIGALLLQLAGDPGLEYEIQRSTSLTGPWQAIGHAMPPDELPFSFLDSNAPPGCAFYRLSTAPLIAITNAATLH